MTDTAELTNERTDVELLRSVNRALLTENKTLRSHIDLFRSQSQELEGLRTAVESISLAKRRIEWELEKLHSRSATTDRDQSVLRARLRELEGEAAHFSTLYVDAEQRNTGLTSLYVASHHLHSSLRRADVLERIQEIIVNLIGSEELAIFELRENGVLELAASFGVDENVYRRFSRGVGVIGETAATGELYIASNDQPAALPAEQRLTACVPLKIEEKVIGVIAIFSLLQQKPTFCRTDHDLFELLSTHAANALYSATLRDSTARVALINNW